MSKIVKIFFLVITLAIPVFIFVFLRVMGNNKFDIPVYYQESFDDFSANCKLPETPYYVPDSLLGKEGRPAVVYFLNDQPGELSALGNQYLRLRDTFNGSRLPELLVYTEMAIASDAIGEVRNVEGSFDEIMHCGFIAEKANQYVLVDKERRIRGYYGTELDEQDRLIVEIKILNENEDTE